MAAKSHSVTTKSLLLSEDPGVMQQSALAPAVLMVEFEDGKDETSGTTALGREANKVAKLQVRELIGELQRTRIAD